MNCSLIDDARAWNSVLLSLPYAHVLQAWQWGEVKARHGWAPNRLLWEHNGPVAAAQILRRRVPRTPWSVLYVPKGPALDYTDAGQVDAILDALEAYARRFRAILIKIDPDVVLWDASNPVVQALERRGWRPSTQQIQFRNTALLDISRPLDDLLATMKSKTRYNIRLAARKGVTVRAGTVADVPCFYRMYAETGRRDGFITRSFEYYCHTWETFLREGMAHMLLAEVGETSEPIAGLILFRFGRTAWYMYGASTSQHRCHVAPALLGVRDCVAPLPGATSRASARDGRVACLRTDLTLACPARLPALSRIRAGSARLHKGAEQRQHLRIVRCQTLRMPLYAHDKGRVGLFNALDHPVRRTSCHD